MKTELRWVVSQSASCFHAARAHGRGLRLVDDNIAAAIDEPARAIEREVEALHLPPEGFWQQVIPLAAGIENNRELAERVLTKLIGGGGAAVRSAHRLAGLFSDAEAAFRGVVPDLVEKLALRARPLQTAWEARGPGLLAAVGRLSDPMVVVSRADVVLVQPILGGAGAAHLAYNSVTVEAVLANPQPRLPEVARLGWLLAQLNLDLPMFSEMFRADRLPTVAALAMLPVVLTASQHVELARCDEESIRLAIGAWQPALEPNDEVCAVVLDWWRTYLDSQPRWSIALAALERMLPQSASASQ